MKTNTKSNVNNVGALSVRNTREDNRTAPIKTNQHGITLIALIITIIVMLILVGVSITIALKGGLFETTKKAAKETEEAKNAEQELASGRVKIDGVWYDSIEDYAIGKKSDNQPPEEPDTSIKSYDNTSKDTNGVLTANATYTSDGKTAMVPKGFKIVDGIEGTKSIANGLVIQDKDGNEFVWIPVEVTESDTQTSIASFYRSEWANNERGASLKDSTTYIEPSTNRYEWEEEEYAEMVKSVYENKGFYIGRYEAGSVTERIQDASRNWGTTEMVVKKDQYPYTAVGFAKSMSDYESDVLTGGGFNMGKGAVYLSKNMYKEKDVGVTSTLCYGVQWDAMLDFIKDEEHNVTDSSSWGLYEGSETITTTGSSDQYVAKNIYDIAGNLYELTMEAETEGNRCVVRGTDLTDTNPKMYASSRSVVGIYFYSTNSGFRPALYIK